MKRILSILVLLLVASEAMAQPIGNANTISNVLGTLKVDSLYLPPLLTDTPSTPHKCRREGSIIRVTKSAGDTVLYQYNNGKWYNADATSGTTYIKYPDTSDSWFVTRTYLNGTFAGSTHIVTLGTIATGVWNGTAITSGYGGTGNAFTKFTGPTTSEKTFTLPNASATILTDNAAVTSQQGGTGIDNGGRTLAINTNSGTIAFSAASKTLTIAKSITLDGTDGTTMTFPSTNATIARANGTNTFTGVQTFSSQATLSAGFINGTNISCYLQGGKVYTSTDNNMWFRGESGSGNFQIAGEGGMQIYPNYTLTTNAVADFETVSDGAGSYKGFMSTGTLRIDGNIVAGYSTYAGATGSGGFKSANPSGGTTTANVWKFGDAVSGVFTLRTDKYLEVDVGNVIYKLALVN